MPSRRNFLKLLGLGTAAAAIPTAAAKVLAKSSETTVTPPADVDGITGYAAKPNHIPNPCREIQPKERIGKILPEQELELIPTDQIPTTLQKLINKHERYQVRAHNGDDYIGYNTKYDCSKAWQKLADKVAVEIEELAQACGLGTIWPGISPVFYPLREITEASFSRIFEKTSPEASFLKGAGSFESIPKRANRPNTGIRQP